MLFFPNRSRERFRLSELYTESRCMLVGCVFRAPCVGMVSAFRPLVPRHGTSSAGQSEPAKLLNAELLPTCNGLYDFLQEQGCSFCGTADAVARFHGHLPVQFCLGRHASCSHCLQFLGLGIRQPELSSRLPQEQPVLRPAWLRRAPVCWDGAFATNAWAVAALSVGTSHPLAVAFHLPPNSRSWSFTGYVFPVMSTVLMGYSPCSDSLGIGGLSRTIWPHPRCLRSRCRPAAARRCR